jgi:hypothetical protein
MQKSPLTKSKTSGNDNRMNTARLARATPEMVLELGPGEVFVFGSNLAGFHGAGAALMARQHFGAQPGVGAGPTGRCYAIPTRDKAIRTLSLDAIQPHVNTFLRYALEHPGNLFLVTPVGCGLARHRVSDMAPMFKAAPSNVVLPASFQEALGWR